MLATDKIQALLALVEADSSSAYDSVAHKASNYVGGNEKDTVLTRMRAHREAAKVIGRHPEYPGFEEKHAWHTKQAKELKHKAREMVLPKAKDPAEVAAGEAEHKAALKKSQWVSQHVGGVRSLRKRKFMAAKKEAEAKKTPEQKASDKAAKMKKSAESLKKKMASLNMGGHED